MSTLLKPSIFDIPCFNLLNNTHEVQNKTYSTVDVSLLQADHDPLSEIDHDVNILCDENNVLMQSEYYNVDDFKSTFSDVSNNVAIINCNIHRV